MNKKCTSPDETANNICGLSKSAYGTLWVNISQKTIPYEYTSHDKFGICFFLKSYKRHCDHKIELQRSLTSGADHA